MSPPRLFRPSVAALLLLLASGAAAASEASPSPVPEPTAGPVAIVLETEGAVHAVRPGSEEQLPVAPLDWFPAGITLLTGDGASVLLASRSGERWRLGPDGAARLETERPEAMRGELARLDGPAVVAPVLGAEPAATPTALTAVRIRGAGFTALYPQGGARALADSAVLAFTPGSSFDRYRVEIEDEQGRVVLQVETRDHALRVPPGVLRPDASYHWRVRSRDALGHLFWEEARFETVAADLESRHAALREALEPSGDPRSLALLAHAEVGLGLWWEARETCQRVLAAGSGDSEVGGVLATLEDLLSDTGTPLP